MATFVYGMNLSLDGYVDHQHFAPGPALFDHWIDYVRTLAGSIYGRRLYEIMRYWDDDQPDWTPAERDFADAWRNQPKWVVSRNAAPVGPNATLISHDVEAALHRVKAQHTGEIDIGGPTLAAFLADKGLIDEYRLYFHPVVLGGGTPFFARALKTLRLVSSDPMGEGVVRLTYTP